MCQPVYWYMFVDERGLLRYCLKHSSLHADLCNYTHNPSRISLYDQPQCTVAHQPEEKQLPTEAHAKMFGVYDDLLPAQATSLSGFGFGLAWGLQDADRPSEG